MFRRCHPFEKFLTLVMSICLLPTVCFAQNFFNGLDKSVNQVIIVEHVKDEILKARLSTWERHGDQWRIIFEKLDAVIGRNGFALLGEKKEGDGRTPSGIFKIRRAFGYEPTAITSLAYKQVSENDFWVDDVASAEYNQWIVGTPQAKSFERLKRDDGLYKYAAVIEYNTEEIVPGAGSAIFLHIWRGADSSTAGCVAVSEENILKLLKWLDIKENPVIVLNNIP